MKRYIAQYVAVEPERSKTREIWAYSRREAFELAREREETDLLLTNYTLFSIGDAEEDGGSK